jgi:hypothetical protein
MEGRGETPGTSMTFVGVVWDIFIFIIDFYSKILSRPDIFYSNS